MKQRFLEKEIKEKMKQKTRNRRYARRIEDKKKVIIKDKKLKHKKNDTDKL